MELVCLTSMLSLYFYFTGSGSSKEVPKEKRQRRVGHKFYMCDDGVKRDKSSLKEHAAYMKQKEKEDRIKLKKKDQTIRTMPLCE